MSRRRCLATVGIIACLTGTAEAQIYNWQTGQVIAGTENVTPGPGVSLTKWNTAAHNLRYADLAGGLDLHGATFNSSWVDYARLSQANLANVDFVYSTLTNADMSQANLSSGSLMASKLTNADLSRANLSNAKFNTANLMNANMTDAVIQGTNLSGTTRNGFTSAQLYSTASWKAGHLEGTGFGGNDMTGWDLGSQNLTGAYLNGAVLTNANLSKANLTNASLATASLTNTDLSDAKITGATFSSTTSTALTAAQLYSTASYKTGELQGIQLVDNDATGWDFTGKNLAKANFNYATVTNAKFNKADLTNANFGVAVLTNTDFTDAVVKGASFHYTSGYGFTADQLYSTASYKARDLEGLNLATNTLRGWNLVGQNLAKADLASTEIANTDLSEANLSKSTLGSALLININLSRADMRSCYVTDSQLTSAILVNTIRPDGHIKGLNLASGETLPIRDFDGNLAITVDNGMKLADGSVLHVLFADDTWGSTVILADGIRPDLGGTLNLDFAPGATPHHLIGTTFDLFNWKGQLPAGEQFSQVLSLPGFQWDLTNLYTTGEVTLLAVPEPATASLLILGGFALLRRRQR